MNRLPPGLPGTFSYADGLAAGLTPDQLRAPTWSKPFHGVRSFGEATTVLDLARAYEPRMAAGQYFSHVTAAVVHRIWLPLTLLERLVLDVAVAPGTRQPRGKRVRGHLLVDRPRRPVVVDGLPVADVRETWCQLATVLGMEDLIIAGESLLAKNRPNRLRLLDLQEAVQAGDRPRQRLLNRALPELREDVRSAKETELRRMLVAEGLPEPRINLDVFDRLGTWVAELDLGYPELLLGIEYDGRDHFVLESQLRKDVHRHELVQDEGWRVIRVTKDDLRDRRAETLARIREAYRVRLAAKQAREAAATASAALPRIGVLGGAATPEQGNAAR